MTSITREPRGFFAVGVYHPKTEANIGTLWRTAHLFGAQFIFTVGHRYARRQHTDTTKAQLHTPLFHFDDIESFVRHLPWGCPLVGVEMDERAQMLGDFVHPPRAAYLLGAEDHGLPPVVLDRCHHVVQIESPVDQSMNVAVAGSLLIYDRHMERAA